MNTNTAANEYETAATNFLSRNGLKFRATLSNSKTAPWDEDGEDRNHYRITISRPEQATYTAVIKYGDKFTPRNLATFPSEKLAQKAILNRLSDLMPEYAATCSHSVKKTVWKNSDRLVFDFWGSVADAQAGVLTVTPYSVLACISSDAYTPETFEDFCAEYGYESDSIKALQQFRRCDRFAKRLRAFFTASEMEQLSEIQ